MGLSDRDWKQVEILEGDNKQTIGIRILRLAGPHSEKIAVLELRTAFSGARGLRIRMEPLRPEEQVVSLAYPSSRLRFVGGRFVKYGDGDKLAGTALLEMYDGDDRLVLDHGASGAPILDCEGVWLLLSSNILHTNDAIPVSSSPGIDSLGHPNVVSVPIQVLSR